MASKQTYECYVCKRNGFPDTRVFLDGKTEDGKTIYKNEDLRPHIHKQQRPSQQQQQQQQLASQKPIWDIVNAKLDRIIMLLEKERQ